MSDELIFPALLVGVAVVLLIVWIYALVSALKNERLDSTMKLVWVLVIVLVSGLGALIYLIVAPNRPSRGARSNGNQSRGNRFRAGERSGS